MNGDEISSDVEYRISSKDGLYTVQAVDSFDGEEADVFDVQYQDDILSFATHWNSNGRLVKCKIKLLSENRIDFTYTYSNQEMWHKKQPNKSSDPT